MWTSCACRGPGRRICPSGQKGTGQDGTASNPAYHRHWVYEDWVVMCANLKLSSPVCPDFAECGCFDSCPSVDMLVNCSLADCIDFGDWVLDRNWGIKCKCRKLICSKGDTSSNRPEPKCNIIQSDFTSAGGGSRKSPRCPVPFQSPNTYNAHR